MSPSNLSSSPRDPRTPVSVDKASEDNKVTSKPLVIELRGYLRRGDLEQALASAERDLTGAAQALLVDAQAMDDYEPAARGLFIEWNNNHRDRIHAVAIVTDRKLWHMVITAMALASGQRLRPFRTVSAARAWLDEANTQRPS